MPTIPWNIGPNETDCEVDVVIHPGERRVMHDHNGDGYPGDPAWAEIIGVVAFEGGKWRKLTDEEWEWLEADAEAIKAKALGEDAEDGRGRRCLLGMVG